jgi:hypothetical protein
MLFSKPIPFEEAQKSRKVKSLLPTELASHEMGAFSTALRERASFSALVDKAEPLQTLHNLADDVLDGEFNLSKAKTLFGQYLDEIGYVAEPDKVGTIQDLSSELRKNVKLSTDVDMALGYGFFEQSQDSTILDEYPCWELYRLTIPKGGVEAERDWPARWAAAGGTLYDERMIARKDDPIWFNLGPFGNPYPPFDYNSGMWVENVARQECIDLGVIDAEAVVTPQTRDFNTDLQASPDIRDANLRNALLAEGGPAVEFHGDVLRFTGGGM